MKYKKIMNFTITGIKKHNKKIGGFKNGRIKRTCKKIL